MTTQRMPTAANLLLLCQGLTEYWSPKIVAQVNDQYIKVAKVKGTLTWHDHAAEDELFLILKGSLRLEFEDGVIDLHAGDFYLVPRGVRHNPIAQQECCLALIEPVTTRHTGEVVTPQTRSIEEQLSRQ